MTPLSRSFYAAKTVDVAKALLGCRIVRTRDDGRVQIARIVETEAYLGEHDLAAHSAKGRTPRTETMFGPPGHLYVYLIYGMHHCFNFVTEPKDHASAVLIRACEPLQAIDDRTDGPGRLARALSVDRTMNGIDLTKRGAFYVGARAGDVGKILRGPRVGVDYAGVWAKKPLRFWLASSSYVSKV